MPVTECSDYKEFLSAWLAAQPHRGRGLRSKLATSLRCRLAYISRVLNGDAHLSPEQALRAARFIGLSPTESRYFRLLVDKARASTAELAEAIATDLRALKAAAQGTKDRLRLDQPLDADAANEYYASWQLSAVHLALTIPALASRERVANALRLPLERVSEIVTTLIRCGVVAEKGGRLAVVNHLMHGDPRSPNARRHLVNWRQRAVEAVQFHEPESLHYSAAVSLSRPDFARIREQLAEAVERAAQVIKSSPEEAVAAVNIDWFLVTA